MLWVQLCLLGLLHLVGLPLGHVVAGVGLLAPLPCGVLALILDCSLPDEGAAVVDGHHGQLLGGVLGQLQPGPLHGGGLFPPLPDAGKSCMG